ncbi:Neuroblastoma-amplified sequence [Bagarius yarrelli]|uniref:Neuroblastoma-amplified sequence n=1 Tax=Bagarius yarrelli TaxID=175774 RepID=A0A556TZK2_BAGYA|nr:Neuroblastoma-amplified sequence [Bagarius yarrelli]
MAADSILEDEEENILYDLLINAEWPPETDTQARGLKEQNSSLIAKAVTGPFRFVLHYLWYSPSSSSLPPGLVRLAAKQNNWHLVLASNGKLLAVVQDQCVEIRSARDEFGSVIGKCQVPKDSSPQWRKVAWSHDCALLAYADSTGTVRVFDLMGSELFVIPPAVSFPGDFSYAAAGLIFLEYTGSAQWSAELLVITYSGQLRSYLVRGLVSHVSSCLSFSTGTNQSFQESHTFSFSTHYSDGVTAAVYHPGHRLLLVGRCKSDEGADSVAAHWGITAWRVLSGAPHYKPVTSYEDDVLASQRRGFFRMPAFRLFSKQNNEQALILARSSGSLTVSSVRTLTNLLGKSCEWFEPSPRVTSAHDGGFLSLECEIKVAQKRSRLESSEDDDVGGGGGGGEDDSDSDEEASAKARYFGYVKQGLYYMTEMERFAPPRKRPRPVLKNYRLLSLRSTTPEELYLRKIDSEEYGEALSLAQVYGLDSDLVYQRQWRKSSVSIASIQDYLCVERVPENVDAAKELLQYGLKGTDLEALIAIGNREDGGRFILPGDVDIDDETYEDFQTMEEEMERKRQSETKKRQELLKKVDFSKLTLEQKELCRSRLKLLCYLDRLATYEESNVQALDILFTFHGSELLKHRLAILCNFPETTSPHEYTALLPEACKTDTSSLMFIPWDEQRHRDLDWCEDPRCRPQNKTTRALHDQVDSLEKHLRNPPVGESVWRDLLQDLLDMQQNVYTCLRPSTCHQDRFSPVGPSFRVKASRLSYPHSMELALAAAREYFNSSATLTDPCINLARALSRLEDLGVKVLPLQVRLRGDRLSLIKQCIAQCPTAYKQSTLLLELARLLRVSGDDEIQRKGQVLILLAEQALHNNDYKASYIHCQDLMAAGSQGWDVCSQLGQCESYTQLWARQDLMAFALTHCPPAHIQNLLTASSSLQTQILYQAVNYKTSQAQGPGDDQQAAVEETAGGSGVSQPSALLQRTTACTIEVLTSTTINTKAVLNTISDSQWWKDSISYLRPLHGQESDCHRTGSTNQNADLEKQGCSPFYEELFNDPYVNLIQWAVFMTAFSVKLKEEDF